MLVSNVECNVLSFSNTVPLNTKDISVDGHTDAIPTSSDWLNKS